jgi:ligand-binding sensor domain-containing protein
MTARLFALFLLFSCQCMANSRDAGEAFAEITAQLFSPSNGLPQSVVTDLAVDAHGLVWIATQEGLRYSDGARIYDVPSSLPLHSGYIDAVVYQPDSGLWVLSHGVLWNKSGGLWHERRLAEDARLFALASDGGSLWVAASDGLWHGVWSHAEGQVVWMRALQTQESLLSVAVDDRRIAVADASRWRLMQQDGKRLLLLASGTSSSGDITRLFFSGNELCWLIFGGTSCAEAHGAHLESVHRNCQPFDAASYEGMLLEASRCGVRASSKYGEIRYWRIRVRGMPDYLDAPVTRMVASPDGSIWLGTFGAGLLRIHPRLQDYRTWLSPDKVSLIDGEKRVVRADVTGFARWHDDLVLSTRNMGLLLLDLKSADAHSLSRSIGSGQSLTHLEDVAADPSEQLWVSAGEQGLWCLAADHWQSVTLPGNAHPWIFQLLMDGNILYAAGIGGIWRLEVLPSCQVGDARRLPVPESLVRTSDRFSTVCPLVGGGLLAGGEMGVVYWASSAAKPEALEGVNALVQDVHHLYCDEDDDVWVAGDKGVVRLWRDAQGWRTDSYADVDGLGDRPVYAVAREDSGRVWLGTSAGPLLLDPTRRTLVATGADVPEMFSEVNPKAVLEVRDSGVRLFGLVSGVLSVAARSGNWEVRALPRYLLQTVAGEGTSESGKILRSYEWQRGNDEVALIGAVPGDLDSVEISRSAQGPWQRWSPQTLEGMMREDVASVFLRAVNWRREKSFVTGPFRLPEDARTGEFLHWGIAALVVVGVCLLLLWLWRWRRGLMRARDVLAIELANCRAEYKEMSSLVQHEREQRIALQQRLHQLTHRLKEASHSLVELGLYEPDSGLYSTGFAEWVLPWRMGRYSGNDSGNQEKSMWFSVTIAFKQKDRILNELGLTAWKACLRSLARKLGADESASSYLCLTREHHLLLCSRVKGSVGCGQCLSRLAEACVGLRAGSHVYASLPAEPVLVGLLWPLREGWRSQEDARNAFGLLSRLTSYQLERQPADSICIVELGSDAGIRRDFWQSVEDLPDALKTGTLKLATRPLTDFAE